MREMYDRYLTDERFTKLVDTITNSIIRGEFTIEDMCEALKLATYKVVESKTKEVMINKAQADNWFNAHSR